jgi:thioredoxin 1
VSRMEDELLIATMEGWRAKILKSDRPVVVEFFTPTCPYCARLTPIFRKLSTIYGDKMKFAMVNAAERPELAEGYGIMGVPTLKFFCDGRSIHEIVGFKPEEELTVEIEKVLQTSGKCISQSSRLYA